MPDNGGWRKKIHGKSRDTREEKEFKDPKEMQDLTLIKPNSEEATAADDFLERRRHGWRKTIQGNRPATPVPVAPLTDDIEDARLERSEAIIPPKDPKPKLIRYTSFFSSLKDASKRADSPKLPNFDEPWAEDSPFAFNGYGDPLVMIDSIRAQMSSSSRNCIPWEHQNTLFCIFDEYRKTREKNDHLEKDVQKKTLKLQEYKEAWAEDCRNYENEIHRLEVLIAKEAKDVERVIKARQGSIIDRKHNFRSKTGLQDASRHMTSKQLDSEIRTRSNQVLLRRPVSPSRKMSVLSRQFDGKEFSAVQIANDPASHKQMNLSGTLQSEVTLMEKGRHDTQNKITGYQAESFSSDGKGDLLPDELPSPLSPVVVGVECDALVALIELGTLVARRRSLDTESFVRGITKLIAETMPASNNISRPYRQGVAPTGSSDKPWFENVAVPPPPQRIQELPRLSTNEQHFKSFSFEPGEDHLYASRENAQPVSFTERGNTMAQNHLCSTYGTCPSEDIISCSNGFTPGRQASVVDSSKSTKIPSPMQQLGRARSERSTRSMNSMASMPFHGRHASRSSVLTADRNHSIGRLQPSSSRRSSGSRSRAATPLKGQVGIGTESMHKSMAAEAASVATSRGRQTIGLVVRVPRT